MIEDDCGCTTTTAGGGAPPTKYSGNPSEVAKSQNPRNILGPSSVMKLTGEVTTMNDILNEGSTSLVVFLRSLG